MNIVNKVVNPLSLKQLHRNWKWLLLLGLGLVTVGILSILFAFTSTIFSVIYLGALLITIGFFEGVKAFKVSKWGSFFLHLFLSILYILVGFYLVFYPAINAMSLTLLIALFLIISGAFKIIFAITKHVPHKTWLIVNGALALILGLLIWQQWPISGLWVIGTFVGIDALCTGISWII